MAPRKQDVATRFWANVFKGEPEECWFWTGALFEDNRGAFRLDGKTIHAHRLAYQLARGKDHVLDAPKTVSHLCGESDCCNPAHLTDGPPMDAWRVVMAKKPKPKDSKKKNVRRTPYVPAHPPLTAQDKAYVLAYYKRGWPTGDIARLLCFHRSTVVQVWNRHLAKRKHAAAALRPNGSS